MVIIQLTVPSFDVIIFSEIHIRHAFYWLYMIVQNKCIFLKFIFEFSSTFKNEDYKGYFIIRDKFYMRNLFYK